MTYLYTQLDVNFYPPIELSVYRERGYNQVKRAKELMSDFSCRVCELENDFCMGKSKHLSPHFLKNVLMLHRQRFAVPIRKCRANI